VQQFQTQQLLLAISQLQQQQTNGTNPQSNKGAFNVVNGTSNATLQFPYMGLLQQKQIPIYLDPTTLVFNNSNIAANLDTNNNNSEQSQNNFYINSNASNQQDLNAVKLRMLLENSDIELNRPDQSNPVKRNSSHVLTETQNVTDMQHTVDYDSIMNSKRFKNSD